MIAGFALRPLVPADAPILLDLVRELAAYERLSYAVTAREEDLHAALSGAPPRIAGCLALHEGVAVGVATWCELFGTFAGRSRLYLEDLYVAPAMRGFGLGRLLLGAAAREALARNCCALDWLVLDWNQAALAFYRRAGAKPSAPWAPWRLTGYSAHQN